MTDCTQKRFFFCLIILSAIIFIWLISPLFYPNSWIGDFQVADPDSILFIRLLEQSILKGKVVEYDNYGAFPYQVYTGFAPVYLRFLMAFVGIVYWLFPNLNIDPVYVAGILPLILPWFTTVMIIWAVNKLGQNRVLTLFCAFGMLPGFAFYMYSGFMRLDYDFLINFYIWSWIICCALYLKTEKHYIVYIASAITALFISTWNGSPFFFFFVTLLGFVYWLIDTEKYNSYITFASITMLIGSLVAFLFVPRTEQVWKDFLSGAVYGYSYMQGGLILVGALFLGFLNYIGRFSRPRTIGLGFMGIVLLLIIAVFHSAIFESTGLLLRKDPIHISISELEPGLTFNDLFIGTGKYGPLFCFFPIIFLFGLPELKHKKELHFIVAWLFIFSILAIYQVRYIRWIGCGYGLLIGITCYCLWKMIKAHSNNCRFAWLKTSIAILPVMAFTIANNYVVISHDAKLKRHRVELIEWLKNNTPPTSGYSDNETPEYGILTYWDQGNFISYYAKRPAVVSNSMWGFKTMADVFSSENEQQAFDLCKKYKLRYVVVEPARIVSDSMLKYWPVMKDMPESPRYNLYYKDLPERENFDYLYFWLTNHVGLTKLGDFGTSEHFRLVFASQSEPGVISKYLMFQCVEGALIRFQLEPDTNVSISAEFKAAGIPFVYKVNGIADKNGLCEFRLPYANGNSGDRIAIDPFYKVSFEKDGVRKLAKLIVPEEAVINGLNLDLETHLSYLSTF